jgi:hypothetical protein
MTFAIRPSNNENRKCTSLKFQENEITLSSQEPPTEHIPQNARPNEKYSNSLNRKFVP